MIPSPVHAMVFGDLINTIVDRISDLEGLAAYGAIVGVLLACGLGLPLPEDITLLSAGLLASSGNISLPGALFAGLFGVLIGDAILFFMGRKYGRKIFLLPGFRSVFTPERVLRAEDKVKRNGPFICFVARFLPGLRTPTFAAAGAMGVRPIVFFSLDGMAALLSVPLWVGLGYWFGNNWEDALHRAKQAQGFIFTFVAALAFTYVLIRLLKRKNRKRLSRHHNVGHHHHKVS